MQDGLKILSCRAPKDMEAYVVELAERESRSVSNMLVVLLREAKKAREEAKSV